MTDLTCQPLPQKQGTPFANPFAANGEGQAQGKTPLLDHKHQERKLLLGFC